MNDKPRSRRGRGWGDIVKAIMRVRAWRAKAGPRCKALTLFRLPAQFPALVAEGPLEGGAR